MSSLPVADFNWFWGKSNKHEELISQLWSIHPSIHPSSHPSIHPSIHPSSQPASQPAIHPSSQSSIHPLASLTAITNACVHVFVILEELILQLWTIHSFIYPSQPAVRPSVRPSIHPVSQPASHLVIWLIKYTNRYSHQNILLWRKPPFPPCFAAF